MASLGTTIKVAPNYPEDALRECIEGWVLVGFSVLKSGKTTEVRVLSSEPKGVFDKAAIETVEKLYYGGENTPEKRVDGVQFKFTWAIDKGSSGFEHCA
ncbi:energy transducer TonB [Spongiibacter nanhainus]|uniref:Protein TonB n=1 Tax=Spongiibacter nanhainus TaxID=2794344 RepID=A0A7T4R2C2_9GAMM|nr:energy transducer TonB [Spongiibacter nanhainus]QQD19164.1 energy transducer TonB [Spongiibacter nanhainus]